MIRLMTLIFVLICVTAIVYGVSADVNKGAAQMSLDGGSRGAVPFPHQAHQARLGDCMVCHNMFAQAKGSIKKAKTDGQLIEKQVMNKLCIQCHRNEKKAGKVSGPTSCAKCHIKE